MLDHNQLAILELRLPMLPIACIPAVVCLYCESGFCQFKHVDIPPRQFAVALVECPDLLALPTSSRLYLWKWYPYLGVHEYCLYHTEPIFFARLRFNAPVWLFMGS